MPSSGLLALVQPDLPRSPTGLRKLRDSNPNLAEQITRLGDLCQALEKMPRDSRGNAFVRSVLTTPEAETDNGGMCERFAQRIPVVRMAQSNLCHTYMPDRYRERLFPTTDQGAVAADPVDLLFAGFQPVSDGWQPSGLERRASLEARRDLVLALLNWELTHTKRIGKRRAHEDRTTFTEFLCERRIITGLTIPTDVWSLHDPARVMRTQWVEHFHGSEPTSPQFVRRSTRLYLTELRLDDGRTIPVAVEVRRKRFLEIVGKMLAVRGSGVQHVEDRRGLRFLYPTVADMQKGAAFIRTLLPLADFMTGDEAYRDTTVPGAPLLPFVAANLPMVSYFRSLGGHRVQIQHFPVTAHLDLIYSRGPEQHALYNLRKYTAGPPEFKFPGLLRWMSPSEIDVIHWNQPGVFEEFVHHVLTSLPS